nr:viral replication A28-like protein [Wadden Sea poxvirus]
MDPISVFFIVLATIAMCIILIQLYTIYENYDNIKEFNTTHSSLEYSKSINIMSLDRRITDINDNILDVKQKWRCVFFDNAYVSVSMFGFKTIKDNVTIRKFTTLDECIDYTFSISTHSNMINPCLYNNIPNKECTFLKSVL